MEENINKDFSTFSSLDTISLLKTNKETGLSSEEVERRKEIFGENKLVEKKKDSIIKIFFSQMNDSTIYVLFAATLVTLIVSIYETVKAGRFDFFNIGDWPDVVLIVAIILLNALLGTIQEVKAQASLDALKNLSSPETTVIRDSKKIKVKSKDLVPGDIVVLEEGDTIGADLRLVEAINLKTNESSLTGESTPIDKNSEMVFSSTAPLGDKVNMVFMSTPVVYGRGLGVVTSTGMNTEIGKIASALDTEEELTPLQKVLAKLSKFLAKLTLLIVVAVFLVDIIWILINGTFASFDAWMDAILSSIALAVAAIPEGLITVVTIVLSIGVQRMVKANTIVRKLASVETLGAVSVICSDKTGTLTQNKMTVLEAYTLNKYYKIEDFKEDSENSDLVLLAKGMSLCSNAEVDNGLYGDPTEIALVVLSNNFGFHKDRLNELYPRVDELPFDSNRKMMSTLNTFDGKNTIFTKGSLDSVIERSKFILDNGKVRPITSEDVKALYDANTFYASKALRVLSLAYKETNELKEEDLIFIGLVAMIDPARPEALPAVLKLKDAGITTIMITGDHKETAFAIAKDLNIASSMDECMEGKDLDKLSKEELKEVVKRIRVFSRVSPQNKQDIVLALKENGNICAMTGDGVNDAPSLRSADIGIAMGITGTDVSKDASDMVLTDDNFASIEKAVEEGRGIYANIKKAILFLLSSNIAEVLVMFFVLLFGFQTPLIAIHLLWINLITDSLPAIALGMDPKDPNNMKESPRDPNEGIFASGGLKNTILYGAVITIGVILAYLTHAFLNGHFSIGAIKEFYSIEENLKIAQTMAFTCLAVSELFNMLCFSNMNKTFLKALVNKNFMMYIAFFAGIILQLIVIEVPFMQSLFSTANLEPLEWAIMIIIGILPLIVHEITLLIRKIKKH